MIGTLFHGPLHGVRIVELAGIGPGPFAAMLLAELGADVVTVDRPGSAEGSAVPRRFDLLRRSRRSVELDLRSPTGVDAVLRLIAEADALIEGNRPGVTERLGLGPEDCWSVNPRLVYGRMTGWGQQGPLSNTAGHDITYLAITGALHLIGREDGPPVVPVNLVGDFGGGSLYLVVGVLAALWEARSSGRGQVVDASIVDGAASLTTLVHGLLAAGTWTTCRGANLLDGGRPWYDVYRTRDDRYVAVGALEPKFYREFCRLLPLDSDETDRADPSRWPALRDRIAEAFSRRTRDEWAEQFADTDACVAPVLTPAEAVANAHMKARGVFTDIEGIVQPGPAPRLSRTPARTGQGPAEPPVCFEDVLHSWKAPRRD